MAVCANMWVSDVNETLYCTTMCKCMAQCDAMWNIVTTQFNFIF